MEKWIKLSLALMFAFGISAHAAGKDPLFGYNDDIPKGEVRNQDHTAYPYDPRFPKEEIKFIGEENGEIKPYEDVMKTFLTPATKEEVEKKNLNWLVVRYPTQDPRYRYQVDDRTVRQLVIIDFRYEPKFKLANGTINAVFLVKEVDGVPQEWHFLKFQYDEGASAVFGEAMGAKDFAKGVLTDVINHVYGLTPVNKPN